MTEEQRENYYLEKDKVERLKIEKDFVKIVDSLKNDITAYGLQNHEVKIELIKVVQ